MGEVGKSESGDTPLREIISLEKAKDLIGEEAFQETLDKMTRMSLSKQLGPEVAPLQSVSEHDVAAEVQEMEGNKYLIVGFSDEDSDRIDFGRRILIRPLGGVKGKSKKGLVGKIASRFRGRKRKRR